MSEITLSRRLFLGSTVGAAAGLFLPDNHVAGQQEIVWSKRVVETQKETQDSLRPEIQVPDDKIVELVDLSREMGVTHLTVMTPYDNPEGVDAIGYGGKWRRYIHEGGLSVHGRGMPLEFQGIHGKNKVKKDFKPLIRDYILSNPSFFQPGDMWAPYPEPQEGGVVGINCTPNEETICQFDTPAQFNQELRDAIDVSKEAFHEIGFAEGDIEVGFYGFTGFVAVGIDNPDWEGKTFLEPATVDALGNIITLDHHGKSPTKYGEDMELVHSVFPKQKLFLGELGPADALPDDAPEDEVAKAYDEMFGVLSQLPYVVGMNMYVLLGGKAKESLVHVTPDGIIHRTPWFEVTKKWFNKMS